jgi:hypothetical protein
MERWSEGGVPGLSLHPRCRSFSVRVLHVLDVSAPVRRAATWRSLVSAWRLLLATGPMSSSVADLIAHLAVPSKALEAAEGLGAMVSMKDLQRATQRGQSG